MDLLPLQFLLMTQILQLQSHGPTAVQGVQTRSLLQTADQLLFGLEDHLKHDQIELKLIKRSLLKKERVAKGQKNDCNSLINADATCEKDSKSYLKDA